MPRPVLTQRWVDPLRRAREAGMTDTAALEWVARDRNSRGRYEEGVVSPVATERCTVLESSAAGQSARPGGLTGDFTLVLGLSTAAEAGMRALLRYRRGGIDYQALVDLREVEPRRPVDVIRKATAVTVEEGP